MMKYLISLILLFAITASFTLNAQEKKIVVLNLKTGYSVKGEIIEQSHQSIKVRTFNGDIMEYQTDEIASKSDATATATSHNKLFAASKSIPQTISKGDKLLGIGLGLIKQLPNGNSYKTSFPPIPASFEYVLKDDLFNGNGSFGIGGLIGYSATNEKYSYWKYTSSRLIIGGRGYLHYALVENLDTYAGALLGFKSDITKTSYNNSTPYAEDYKTNNGSPILNMFAGCRYFFNDKIAGMAEVGWGLSIATIGITIKL